MLRRLSLALICACCSLTGCHVSKSAHSSPVAEQTVASQEKSINAVDLYLAFVQTRLGDPFFNKDVQETDPDAEGPAQKPCLWSSTDHHVVNIEQQIVLEDNGYRVGQIVGIMPAKLMKLLDSPRTCIDPRHRVLSCGEPATLAVGPILQRSTFHVKHGGQVQHFALEQARYCLDVTANLTKDGRTRLEFTPRVEHRAPGLAVDLAPDLSGFVNKLVPPHHRFPLLGWQVTLKPGEALVIGANLERPGSLGCRSFLQDDMPEPVQRVLVVRTSRPLDER
jgi:hypothetical protein